MNLFTERETIIAMCMAFLVGIVGGLAIAKAPQAKATPAQEKIAYVDTNAVWNTNPPYGTAEYWKGEAEFYKASSFTAIDNAKSCHTNFMKVTAAYIDHLKKCEVEK